MNAGPNQICGDKAIGVGRTLRNIAEDLTDVEDDAKFAAAASAIPVAWPGHATSLLPTANLFDVGCQEMNGSGAAMVFAQTLPLLDLASGVSPFDAATNDALDYAVEEYYAIAPLRCDSSGLAGPAT